MRIKVCLFVPSCSLASSNGDNNIYKYSIYIILVLPPPPPPPQLTIRSTILQRQLVRVIGRQLVGYETLFKLKINRAFNYKLYSALSAKSALGALHMIASPTDHSNHCTFLNSGMLSLQTTRHSSRIFPIVGYSFHT